MSLVEFSRKVQAFYQAYTPAFDVDTSVPSDPVVYHACPIVAVILYWLMLIFFPKLQKKYNFIPNKGHRQVLFVAWNLFLSIYSGIAFLYVFTWYVLQIQEHGSFWNLYCPKEDMYYNGANVFWYWTFAISKYFELFDTFFLLLKNPERPPKFLHWYHHSTVVFAAWWFFKYRYSPYFFGMMMNTFIHFNMYLYYALTAFFRPPWAFLLTVLQISQMCAGSVVYTSWLYRNIKEGCYSHHGMWMGGYSVLLYMTYNYLFIKFMLERYFGFGGKKKRKGKKGKGGKKGKKGKGKKKK